MQHFWTDYESNIRIDDVTFLSERFIVATVLDGFRSVLAVFDARDSESELLTAEESLPVASALLELPSLGEGYVLRSLPIDCRPKHPIPPTTCHDALFTPSHSSAIVHVQLPLEHWLTGREVNFDLLIPRRVILQHARLGPVLDGSGELTYTEPSKWFHKGRLIKARSMAKGAVYGSRCIMKEAVESGLSVAAIYDFRPLPTALYDLGHDEDVEFILEDGWDVSDIFKESQRTAAPYRRIKSNIILKDDEYPQLTEDGIIIVNRTGLNSYQ